MDYYKQIQYIAEVDKNDQIIGQIEKWEAHEKAILHRAFTMILKYDNKYVLQHRRHPVFDGYYDLSFSSHQIYLDSILQDDMTAIYSSLKREWNIDIHGLIGIPKKIGTIYYKEKDPNSIYSDHEIDYIYIGYVKEKPNPNKEYAYDFLLVEKEFLVSDHKNPYIKLAPWVLPIIRERLI